MCKGLLSTFTSFFNRAVAYMLSFLLAPKFALQKMKITKESSPFCGDCILSVQFTAISFSNSEIQLGTASEVYG